MENGRAKEISLAERQAKIQQQLEKVQQKIKINQKLCNVNVEEKSSRFDVGPAPTDDGLQSKKPISHFPKFPPPPRKSIDHVEVRAKPIRESRVERRERSPPRSRRRRSSRGGRSPRRSLSPSRRGRSPRRRERSPRRYSPHSRRRRHSDSSRFRDSHDRRESPMRRRSLPRYTSAPISGRKRSSEFEGRRSPLGGYYERVRKAEYDVREVYQKHEFHMREEQRSFHEYRKERFTQMRRAEYSNGMRRSEPPREMRRPEPRREMRIAEPPREMRRSEPPREMRRFEPPREMRRYEPSISSIEMRRSELSHEIRRPEPPRETIRPEPPREIRRPEYGREFERIAPAVGNERPEPMWSSAPLKKHFQTNSIDGIPPLTPIKCPPGYTVVPISRPSTSAATAIEPKASAPSTMFTMTKSYSEQQTSFPPPGLGREGSYSHEPNAQRAHEIQRQVKQMQTNSTFEFSL